MFEFNSIHMCPQRVNSQAQHIKERLRSVAYLRGEGGGKGTRISNLEKNKVNL